MICQICCDRKILKLTKMSFSTPKSGQIKIKSPLNQFYEFGNLNHSLKSVQQREKKQQQEGWRYEAACLM